MKKLYRIDPTTGRPLVVLRGERFDLVRFADEPRRVVNLAARVSEIVLQSRAPALRRIEQATARNVNPETPEELKAAAALAKKPAGKRALKIATGAAGGYLIGRKWGGRAGAVAGAAAGLVFEDNNQLRSVDLSAKPSPSMNSTALAKSLHAAIDQANAGFRRGTRESHTLTSLARNLGVTPDAARTFLATGILKPESEVVRGNRELMVYLSDDLNAVRRAVFQTVVEKAVELSDGTPSGIQLAAHLALQNVKNLAAQPSALTELAAARPDDEDEDEPLKKAATVAAATGAAYAGASYLRGRAPGRGVTDAIRAGHQANVATARKVGAAARAGASKAALATADVLAKASETAKRAAVLAMLRRGK